MLRQGLRHLEHGSEGTGLLLLLLRLLLIAAKRVESTLLALLTANACRRCPLRLEALTTLEGLRALSSNLGQTRGDHGQALIEISD